MKPRAVRLRLATLVVAVAALLGAEAAGAADRIFWANAAGSISFARLDGTGGGGQLNISGATASNPAGVAIDLDAGRILWANSGNNTISFARLDGTGGGGQLNISGATANSPSGVAIDPTAGRIYWSNSGNSTVSFARLDGTGGGGQHNLGGATVNGPRGVTVNPATGRLYWANSGNHTIKFAFLNATAGGELDITGAPANFPLGVALDAAAGRIYWANALGNTIAFANLNGTGGGQLNISGTAVNNPQGVAIDPAAGRIYWADNGTNTIKVAKLDGTGGGQLNTTGAAVGGPRFLALLKSPSGTGAPAISGGSTVGSALSCSQGNWASDLLGSFLYWAPRSFGYQWLRNGAAIIGATASSYTARDAGSYSCRVTATNQAGSTSQTSAAHAVAAGGGTPATPPAQASFAGSRSSIRVSRRGRFRFSLQAGPGLTGRAVFKTIEKVRLRRSSRNRRRITLARKAFTVPGDGNVTLKLKLSRKSLRILKLNRRIRVRVTVTLENAAELTSTASKEIILKAPKRRRS